MVLDFEYGINTGNRFLQFVDHDEEPEAFIAAQAQEEAKQKKTVTKDTKQPAKKTTTTTKTATTTAKTNKENLTTKSTNVERRQQSATVPAVFGDNNNQQIRSDSARGSRGGSRRGGPPFDGAGRGRSQRFTKFEGQGSTNESNAGEQGGDSWNNESGTRGGSRGRGGPRRGNFEGGRGNFEGGRGGAGRGRGGRGRGYFNNRSQEEGGAPQETSAWQQSTETNFESARPQSNREYDPEVSPLERPLEPDNTRRNTRGNYRGRTFHNNRNFGDREGGEGTDEYRANRRQTDRQPRSHVT
ncbi:unnamed protein product, partial [Rotaria magnacalcarata]